jgi:hypothetical protein
LKKNIELANGPGTSRRWMIAERVPRSRKTSRKFVTTSAIASSPNAEGSSRRASTR